MTRILAIDTSTLVQSLALSVDGEVVAHVSGRQKGGHSRSLAVRADEMLSSAGLGFGDLDAFAIDIGPGSFTGLRVGLSLAKGVAAVFGTSVLPVRSVDAMAAPFDGPTAVAFDAHNHLVYGAVVDGATELVPLEAWAPDAFGVRVAAVGAARLLGAGWSRYGDEFRAAGLDIESASGDAPDARGVLLAAQRLAPTPLPAATVEPLYVRKSAAEERLERS